MATRSFLGIHPLHHSKLWYFLSFGAFACLSPFLPLFYRSWGIDERQIGLINCLRPLVSFWVTPMWGALADWSGRHNAILFAKMLAQGYGYSGLLWLLPNHSFKILFAYVACLEALCCANNSLADSSTGQMCRRARRLGESPTGGIDYGSQRLWGAVSWGYVFAPLSGAIQTFSPARVKVAFPFVAFPALLTLSAFVSLGMDFTPEHDVPKEDESDGGEAEEGTAVPAPGGADFRTPRKSAGWADRETSLEMTRIRSSPDETSPAGEASPARIDPRTGYAGLGPGFNGVRTPTKEGSVKVLGVDLSVHEDDFEEGEFSDDSAAATVDVKAADAAVVGSIPRRGERAVASRVFAVVAKPDNALHFLLFLIMGASMAVTDTFLFLWLEELGGSKFLMGLALMFTCLSEVVVFAKEAAIKRALSTEWCVALVLFCYGVRQVFYASLGRWSTPWVVLPVQLLHGVTFGLYWSVGNAFVHDIAPRGLNAAVMTVFGGCVSGGGFLGAVLGGVAYAKYGGAGLWFGVGCVNFALCGAVVGKIRGCGGGGDRTARGWRRLGTDEDA